MQMYHVIGVMSGTSLDGVDIAYCTFTFKKQWEFNIVMAQTIPYSQLWQKRLSQLPDQPAMAFAKTDFFFGKYIGKLVADFIKQHNITVDFIASHGHTIFHQPTNGFTTQIGSGAAIYAETGLPVICDFRSVDVALGGQGAPLVPIGDKLLFNQFDACLNLGGFSNISFAKNNITHAFDVSVCNVVMNKITQQMGFAFDDGGKIAAFGTVHNPLLAELNKLEYYQQATSKSLGVEWVQQYFWPVLQQFNRKPEDLLATINLHIAQQIAAVINKNNLQQVLVTGGGVYNKTLLDNINQYCKNPVTVPHKLVIEFKEALIFAFLGVLNLRGEDNCLKSVTGALADNMGGCWYGKLPIHKNVV